MRVDTKLRKSQEADPRAGSDQALYADAVHEARRLKRKHRALFHADPHRFRAQVRKAHGRVFRLKPGPKADTRIAKAARELARNANLRDLFPKYIDGFGSMSEFTRALAEEGFRKKVSGYLRRHPRLRGIRTKVKVIPR